MGTIFKYKNKIYQCNSLEKKLKRLKIDRDDIDILYEGDDVEQKYLELNKNNTSITKEDLNDIKLYYFINKDTGYSITSINPTCKFDNYESTTKEYLEKFWNKNGSV